MSSRYHSGQQHQKKKSRDAARSRRGQQNDEYTELANQLPLSVKETSQLDRLSVMRLANSFIKVKHFLKNTDDKELINWNVKEEFGADGLENQLLQALDGFVFVIGFDGQCLYISDNVSTYLGLMPVEVIGNSFYKFIHPCDHEEVAKELGGKIPLEDMEIFDGLFCSDSVFIMANNLKGGSTSERNNEIQPYRSFFVRMKSTLTSRGKNVNLKASTYRVVHCTGCMKTFSNVGAGGEKKPNLCFVGIGVPLMFTPTFEVPLDRCTFSSQHTLDLTFIYCEEGVKDILGYSTEDMLGQSLYTFHHGCDSEILTNCHKTLLTKGQSVSGYYRLLAKYGGWIWVQTKASIVYATKNCQPQFVLCVHYAISDVQNEDSVLSLDQLRGVQERQGPAASKDSDSTFRKSVFPTNQVNMLENNETLKVKGGGQSGSNADMDIGDVTDYNEEVNESEECSSFSTLGPERPLSLASGGGSEPKTPPEEGTSFYENVVQKNPDQCAPFIPPPLGDSQFLMSCVDMFSEDDLKLDSDLMWNTDWEIFDTDNCEGAEGELKKNLSTPKFFPDDEEELPVLNSKEIEMSTPVPNLPLLQGNEIWFALDQCKEVSA